MNGVQLPAEGRAFFTWDPVLRRSPNRAWRRVGSDRLVRTLLAVLEGFAAAHPGAPRIGVGDISRPGGGDFGIRYGRPGHVSHQNGLDVDVYYPRRDGRERPPGSPAQIDRALAQELVDRFVRAGAVRVFVGPSTGLTGRRSSRGSRTTASTCTRGCRLSPCWPSAIRSRTRPSSPAPVSR